MSLNITNGLGRGFFGQWPLMIAKSYVNCAVCWKHLLNSTTTVIVRGINLRILSQFSENVVLWMQSAGNQQHVSSLVGTSETKRAATFPISFFPWLAGVIDGNGCLLVSKQGYTSLEITMGLEDLPLLVYIQNFLGGSIKMRSGAKAYRYRLHNTAGMIILINGINGLIRHSIRTAQLHRVCSALNIPPLVSSVSLDTVSPWFAGFFDADGTFGFSFKNGLPQLSLRVTNKFLVDVQAYLDTFGGNIYYDTRQNGYYQWSVQSRVDVIRITKLLSLACRSNKSRRFFLVNDYYELYDLRAFLPDSIHHKAWLAFLDKWNRK
ncbi:MAG: hypothetical protein JZD40_04760 [Sulfolobus sp.]|nr:hypothetical protein [Sulfolobus sp.]